ncbi:Hypothetical protein A7982_10778 [Minicystis rosea]|nr:Hypothetical protein A7982_10778 [Minicystis rosea]
MDLAWSGEAPFDPIASVLAMVDPIAPEPIAEPAVRFVLRSAGPEIAADPRAEGWEPSFFHGIVQAYRRGGGFLLWDRASRVHLPEGDAPIEVAVAAREVEPGSAAAMIEVAIPLALRRFGLFHIHAAALRHPSGESILVAGGSGAGKTSTTIALIEAGSQYLGDDAHFLSSNAGGLCISVFPRAFHLAPATIAAFPRLEAFAGPPSGRRDKRALDARRAFPDRHLATMPLSPGRVLALFPSVVDAPVTELLPIPRADAFGLLLASSAALVIDGLAGRDENLRVIQAVLTASRCFELRLGRDALVDPRAEVAARIARCTTST